MTTVTIELTVFRNGEHERLVTSIDLPGTLGPDDAMTARVRGWEDSEDA